MGFMRRKSVAATDTEDSRPRNRLSKPMTSKSPSSQRTASGKHSPPRTATKDVSVSSQLTLSDLARSMSLKEPGIQVQTHPILRDADDIPPPTPPKDAPKKTGVASLVKQFEHAASNSQLSFTSSAASQKPLSSTSGSMTMTTVQKQHHMHNIQSRGQLSAHSRSLSTVTTSPTDSLERLSDPFTIPRRRESKYRPGEATRKPDPEDKENQSPTAEPSPRSILDKALPPIQAQEQDEVLEHKWTPTPPVGRSGTPLDLEQKAIGTLRLGSLRIVNGRSSPVLSELSRHLISRQLRDVSSEYADSVYSKDQGSETWEDADVVDDIDDVVDEVEAPTTPTRTMIEHEPQPLSDTPKQPQTPIHRKPLPMDAAVHTPDRTSIMAQSYISELQGSPFSYGTSSPTSPISPISPISTISTGSVQHRYKEEPSFTPESYVDHDDRNTRRISINSERPSIESEGQTVVSMPSIADTANTRDQIFTSALEFQAPHFEPPPSPERGVSPQSSNRDSISRPSEHADSGYQSGDSVLSFDVDDDKLKKRPTPLRIQTAPVSIEIASPSTFEKTPNPTSPKKEQSPRKLGRFFPIRSAARKSQIVESPLQNTVQSHTQTPVQSPTRTSGTVKSESDSVAAIKKVDEKPKTIKSQKEETSIKSQNKLHKLRPHSRARESKEIIVQRLVSCDSTLDIPAIPETAKANLQFRSQQVPELDKTYTSQHHIKNHPSTSSLVLPLTEIRFPSPMPSLTEENDRSSRSAKRDRSRGIDRPRSKSRRRSFLERFRSDKDATRCDTGGRQEEAQNSISDFGDVMRSLGTNPYDIAHTRPQSRDRGGLSNVSSVNPHNISSNTHRKRISMNDEEAAEYARIRSFSLNHGDKQRHTPTFDHRGDFYDRLRRMSMTEEEIPPLPPMPDQQELKRISARLSMQSQTVTTPTREQHQWNKSPSSDRHIDHSPVPLPPAHSPRPLSANYKHRLDHATTDAPLAPPPPSHSPAPRDITAHQVPTLPPQISETKGHQDSTNPWNDQARAWRERRLSAGEALEHHRQSSEFHGADFGHGDEVAIDDDDDGPIYPVIPPRNPERQYRQSKQAGHWTVGNNGYGDQYNEFYPQRSHTWDTNGHDPYQFDQEREHHSQSSYQSRQQRHNTWTEMPDHVYDHNQSQFYHQDGYGSHQMRPDLQRSPDSRHSFYSHYNCPIDRPFDGHPTTGYDSEDEYGYQTPYYPPEAPPARSPARERQGYDYTQPHGYEKQYHQQQYMTYHPQDDFQDQHGNSYTQSPRVQPDPRSQDQYYHHPQIYPQRNSYGAHSPRVSRPSSHHSQGSFTEDMRPDARHRQSNAPEYGRYSGGMGFGYEGRNAGFGGSAGTRGGSGKADAAFKGITLRGSHGVDLGDVPIIGVVKKI